MNSCFFLQTGYYMTNSSSKEFWETHFKRDSPWNTWNSCTQESSIISVLVLEPLGEPCSNHWEHAQQKPSEGFKCVTSFLVCIALVMSNYLSFQRRSYLNNGGRWNLRTAARRRHRIQLHPLHGRYTSTPQARCPRHNTIHG